MTISIPPWFLIAVFLAVGAATVGCGLYWNEVSDFVSAHEAQLKVLSLLLGPIATVASVYWGYKSKQDLVDHSTKQTQKFADDVANYNKELLEKVEALGRAKAIVEHTSLELEQKKSEVDAARTQIEQREARIEKLEGDLEGITEGSQELWKLRPSRPFPEYRLWHRDPAAPTVVTFSNLKGGVGKTTLAANFAAYVSETLRKRVLIVDLDFQGSLSNMLMLAAEQEVVGSAVDQLLEASDEDGLARVSRAKVQLVPVLPRCWLIPASYTLVQTENHLLLKWLLKADGQVDVRYRLAKALLAPSLFCEFDVIILDTPPRMTLGTINALVASHWFVVPTALDRLSAEAVPQFISNLKNIKSDLQLDIDLGGIAGMMSRVITLSANETQSLDRAREGGHLWRESEDYVLRQTIPRRAAIAEAAGASIAYFENDGGGNALSTLFDPLFAELAKRMKIDVR